MTRGRKRKAGHRLVHFIGFRGEEYWSAVKVWGKPDYYHRGFDRRMWRDIANFDVLVFANGWETKGPTERTFPDIEDCRI